MTHEAAIRTVFPAKKSTKRHKKHLVSVSTCYPRHLDGIPKKWPSSRRLPFKNNEGSVRSSVASQNAPSTLSTFLTHTYKRSVSFQSNKFWTPYSRMSERTHSLKKNCRRKEERSWERHKDRMMTGRCFDSGPGTMFI